MNIIIRKFQLEDLSEMIKIWNDVVEDGIAFPQEELLTDETGKSFFEGQTYCGVVVDSESKRIFGLYILHPNNIGRCSHICNASYAVDKHARCLRHCRNVKTTGCCARKQYAYAYVLAHRQTYKRRCA